MPLSVSETTWMLSDRRRWRRVGVTKERQRETKRRNKEKKT